VLVLVILRVFSWAFKVRDALVVEQELVVFASVAGGVVGGGQHRAANLKHFDRAEGPIALL